MCLSDLAWGMPGRLTECLTHTMQVALWCTFQDQGMQSMQRLNCTCCSKEIGHVCA
jgi:hypothetical protein